MSCRVELEGWSRPQAPVSSTAASVGCPGDPCLLGADGAQSLCHRLPVGPTSNSELRDKRPWCCIAEGRRMRASVTTRVDYLRAKGQLRPGASRPANEVGAWELRGPRSVPFSVCPAVWPAPWQAHVGSVATSPPFRVHATYGAPR